VIAIGDEPNGFNINDGVGATLADALAAAVREHHADVGIALDGDGDRLLMADASGRTYDGDQLLYVIARRRERRGGLAGVVGTLMTNLALERALGELGVGFARAKVGDRYVLELLQEKGWDLGGENSGHIICLDKHTTGDAIVSGLQVLAAVREEGRDLAAVAGAHPPQRLINVGHPASTGSKRHRGRARLQSSLGSQPPRASGTEPVRVMVEGEDGGWSRRAASWRAPGAPQRVNHQAVAGGATPRLDSPPRRCLAPGEATSSERRFLKQLKMYPVAAF
jgi:phosphoglucosamine mutase